MSKTELEIAKENIDLEVNFISKCEEGCEYSLKICQTHKATCQRWLEFLEEWFKIDSMDDLSDCNCDGCKFVNKKITDLKNTIKLYEDNGI